MIKRNPLIIQENVLNELKNLQNTKAPIRITRLSFVQKIRSYLANSRCKMALGERLPFRWEGETERARDGRNVRAFSSLGAKLQNHRVLLCFGPAECFTTPPDRKPSRSDHALLLFSAKFKLVQEARASAKCAPWNDAHPEKWDRWCALFAPVPSVMKRVVPSSGRIYLTDMEFSRDFLEVFKSMVVEFHIWRLA